MRVVRKITKFVGWIATKFCMRTYVLYKILVEIGHFYFNILLKSCLVLKFFILRIKCYNICYKNHGLSRKEISKVSTSL